MYLNVISKPTLSFACSEDYNKYVVSKSNIYNRDLNNNNNNNNNNNK